MPPVGFETTISAGERPKTYALNRAATRTGTYLDYGYEVLNFNRRHYTPSCVTVLYMYFVTKDNAKLSEMFKVICCDADLADVEYSSKNLSTLKSPLRILHKAKGPFNLTFF
jgi:hypothetical protein